jgi:large subunit ribosomal protein L15
MPLQRRVPKRGFTNIFREAYSIVNVEALGRFAEGSEVGPVELAGAGLISKADALVKLLGSGSLDRPVTVRVHRASASAVEKIRAAGGQVQLIPVKKE